MWLCKKLNRAYWGSGDAQLRIGGEYGWAGGSGAGAGQFFFGNNFYIIRILGVSKTV
jgi:hypothetical protein